ncbi:radical SAM family heme chaperone HemW [Lutispora saccharofermentans]|uniref:Heme chaperone HemW n=1 Tax=Lutispora saccharofermentans TaxID=3024236 RepID=A0ABT1NHW3_9FIRM|nr:radical SAM family heme chaperone HemW [Lutispora saccharofermentans]MCQ1530873.1 radical SAM family heme chaperone HemW [Lutispora saccharofermentans]
MKKSIGLYVHIPFCQRKCIYCDFNSYDDKAIYEDAYIDALIKELKYYSDQQNYNFKTIFIGGGTPTIINPKNIAKIMKTIEKNIEKEAEITIECNPGTVDQAKIDIYKAAGINRISIGLQAWQDELLNTIGRIHKREDFLRSFSLFRSLGFNNINVDLMFSLPGQSLNMWLETLDNVCRLGAEHISCYSLIVEENTPIHSLIKSGILNAPDEDMDRDMYKAAKAVLKNYGLKQYEISNFAKEGFCCEHNLIYWKNGEYAGVGAGSHSKIDGKRFWNFSGLDEYIKNIEAGKAAVEGNEDISIREDMWETIILGLRLNSGIGISDFNAKYEINFIEEYGNALSKLIKEGLITIQDDRVRLTHKGQDLSNRVFVEFMQ